MTVSNKAQVYIPYEPANPHVDIYPSERYTYTLQDLNTRIFIAVLFAIAQSINYLMTTNKRINKQTLKLWYIYTISYYIAIKISTLQLHSA